MNKAQKNLVYDGEWFMFGPMNSEDAQVYIFAETLYAVAGLCACHSSTKTNMRRR